MLWAVKITQAGLNGEEIFLVHVVIGSSEGGRALALTQFPAFGFVFL